MALLPSETFIHKHDSNKEFLRIDVIVFIDPSAEIDDQLFQYFTMVCGLELNWFFVYCPAGGADGDHSMEVWRKEYLPRALLHLGENPISGHRTHISLETFKTLESNTFITSHCLLLAPLALGYTGANIKIWGNLITQGSLEEGSFNVSDESRIFMEKNSDKLIQFSSDKCKDMLPTNKVIRMFPKYFQENIYGAGFKFIVGRMPPSHPVANRFAPGLVSESESGRQRNMLATIAYYELVNGKGSYATLQVDRDEDYFRLSQQYFNEIAYPYEDKEACILSLAKMCKAMNNMFSQEIFNSETSRVFYSDFETTHLLPDGETHSNNEYSVLRDVYPDFIETMSDPSYDGFLETLNPLYDLFVGFCFVDHIITHKSWDTYQNLTPEDFNQHVVTFI